MEINNFTVCRNETGHLQYDPYYKQVGELGTEFQLQEENGIIEKLVGLNYHERYVDYGQKTLEIYSSWIRPTIQLSREGRCASLNQRQIIDRLETINEEFDWSHGFLIYDRAWYVYIPWWFIMIVTFIVS